ncbi:MAG: carbohydrate kinase family protein [Myxococcaceae bacterium]
MALDVICVGETLVDFLPAEPGHRMRDVESWVRCSGGSPANVAIGVARLGGTSAMLGVVGHDEFGAYLRESLGREGVDVSHLRQTEEGKTGLVFISLGEKGERSFSFHRTRAAEFFLADRDVDEPFLRSAKALHFGSNSLLFREAQRAAIRMAEIGKAAGLLVCVDPNLRLHVWPDPNELKEVIKRLVPGASMVKLAEDEIEFVTGSTDPEKALELLRAQGVVLPIVTLGERGAVLLVGDRVVSVSAPSARVIDTTGAGDGFVAAMLFGVTRAFGTPAALSAAHVGEIRQLAAFACAAGARVCERLGAVSGLPRIEELSAVVPAYLRG